MAVDGTIKEKKKKKKIKEGELGETKNKAKYHQTSVQTNVKTEVKICDGDDAPKKKKKKKIKEEKVKEKDIVCCEASSQTAIKAEPMEINSGEGGQEENNVPRKEKKKKKIKREEIMELNISDVGKKMDGDHLEESRIKKAKKDRDKQMEVNGTETGEIKKKKKKKKKKEVEVKEEEVDVGNNGEIDKKKKKKRKNIEDEIRNPKAEDREVKKKRRKTETNVKTEESEACIGDERTKKKKKKDKNTSLKTESNVECVEADEHKVKTKKKKKLASLGMDEMNTKTKKSKKQKKLLESMDDGPAHVNGTKEKANVTGDVIGKVKSSDEKKKKKIKVKSSDEEEEKKKKNIKVKDDDVTEKIEEEPLEKKRSKKDRNEPAEKEDIVFLSAKPGNQDEVSIDQARRLALQKEIDQESQPEVNVGQWSTAQFDSSDRQAKFLRLMGGFKKSSQPITGSAGRANMALGSEGQQTLQQGLLGQFERAQSRHMDFGSRGTGLGFIPPSNKKFAIDVNARKSIRFDD